METLFAKKVEEIFKTKIKEASASEDMNEHWDFSVELKFDVKGLKKVKRSDSEPNEEIHWVELVNVNKKKGFLYGEATHFAFETNDYWIIVEKTKLQNFIADKCKDKIKCATPTLYQLYTREGRKDVITLVKTIDLIYISDLIVKKD
jgi:hypothetical protein